MAYDWKKLEHIDRERETRLLWISGWTYAIVCAAGLITMLVTHSTKLLVATIFWAIVGASYLGMVASRRRAKRRAAELTRANAPQNTGASATPEVDNTPKI